MKAIILAAGIGSRLKPLTNAKPKTLVRVNNKPIISYILDSLYINGIKDIVICIGYRSSQIIGYCKDNYPFLTFTFIQNDQFQDTNNMYSLYLARKFLNDDLILMNADLVFDNQIIKRIVSQTDTCVAVDRGCYMEESMKVIVFNGIITRISKKIDKSSSYGCSIDIYKINKIDSFKLLQEIERIVNVDNNKNQWTEVALDNLFYSKKIKARPFDIKNSIWCEIDDHSDLERAESLLKKKNKIN